MKINSLSIIICILFVNMGLANNIDSIIETNSFPKETQNQQPSTINFLKDISEIVTAIVGVIITIIVGRYAYVLNRKSTILQKNQWHSQLFNQFYVENTYKKMRYILDFKPEAETARLIESLKVGSEDSFSEEFFDYLNFFEFISSLWKNKQIDYKEIEYLFEYYLINLSKTDFVMKEINEEGFELLRDLLKELEKERKKKRQIEEEKLDEMINHHQSFYNMIHSYFKR